MKEFRRVPLSQLRKRLKVTEYEMETPYDPAEFPPRMVRIKLAQHVGKPATPVVAVKDKVNQGQIIARVDQKDLGVNIHASVKGSVTAVTDKFIEIQSD
jgi:Na+-translocating ferredoxin:NAD+ oxidoreductase RnfC subunit